MQFRALGCHGGSAPAKHLPGLLLDGMVSACRAARDPTRGPRVTRCVSGEVAKSQSSDQRTSAHRCWFILDACSFVVLVFALRRFFLSDTYQLAATVQDDSFYYIVPAFNLKSAGFFTFDGRNPTYGFQPLYMLLLGGL